MPPSTSDAPPEPPQAGAPVPPPPLGALAIDGAPLRNAYDVARYFGVAHGTMVWVLYTAPENQRYRTFEIPKRSGGMRRIDAPTGLVRQMQKKLAPILAGAYEAHPSAHGFIKERGVLSNAKGHAGQRLVLNIDLEDFFPSINFGRIRGLFMAAPFLCGPGAATVLAQICTLRNGLPQGAPTSPALSNFIAASLDRRLTRLAKDHNLRYSRYADDITFSTNQGVFPPAVAMKVQTEGASLGVRPGEALDRAIAAAGFAINLRKVRLQSRSVRQNVTGLTVNVAANVERSRIRKVRAMLHAWEKFGLDAAGSEHFLKHRGAKPKKGRGPVTPGAAFRNVVYGQLAYIKMVRGPADPVFLKLCGRVLDLDPNPSKFIKQMVFGAENFEVFISHASEDKELIARPIYEACERLGLKTFLDEPHIGWGENFTKKINTALGSARTVLAIVSSNSVAKDWPVLEINTALAMEVNGQKRVVPLIVGKPDLAKFPLLKGKNHVVWASDPDKVALRLLDAARPPPKPRAARPASRTAVPATGAYQPVPAGPNALPPLFAPYPPRAPKPKRSFLEWIFGRRG
ncbi:MAG: TIR domain-containing protein [Alphaproteobacteria bacterium]|nr:TIR domain-containing protein [Alphaproteobacteria bacterium]